MFRQVGLSLPVDRTCHSELNIKGFPRVEVSDWHRGYEDLEVDVAEELERPEAEDTEFIVFLYRNE